MGIIISLNQTGYDNLKSDRQAVIEKIEELQIVLRELDPAYQHLKYFYEPKVKIFKFEQRDGKEVFKGKIEMSLPDKVTRRRITFTIDYIDSYKSETDERLIEKANEMARETLKERFPTYFE